MIDTCKYSTRFFLMGKLMIQVLLYQLSSWMIQHVGGCHSTNHRKNCFRPVKYGQQQPATYKMGGALDGQVGYYGRLTTADGR